MRRSERVDNETGHLVTYFGDKSSYAEEYRTLRTNLSFAKAGGGMKSIVITSSGESEGKSLSASNLSVVMAQQGQSVLLIDADIRRPVQHKTFNTDNSRGLTNLLTGQGTFKQVIRPSAVDGLSLLTSGPISPNPADLISSMEMAEVIQEAERSYEMVIIDTPPVLYVADALLLADLCDGVLLVVRSGKTELENVRKAVEALSEVKGKMLGCILNDKKISRKRRDHYYYQSY